MSYFYLSPTIGDGSYDFFYQPIGMDHCGATSVNLGDTNQYIIWVPEQLYDPRLIKIAEDGDEMVSGKTVRAIESRLRLTTRPKRKRFGELFFDLLRHPDRIGLDCKPLRPSRKRGQYELTLNEKTLHTEPGLPEPIYKRVTTFAEYQWSELNKKYVRLRQEGYDYAGAWALATSLSDNFDGAGAPPTGWTGNIHTFTEGSGILSVTSSTSNDDGFCRLLLCPNQSMYQNRCFHPHWLGFLR